ncbi:MAG: sodium:alanine symporter family protein, partial [Deltaproteobacteria bacterium]
MSGKWDGPNEKGEITYFQALSTALSATIGTGNIAGVATAIAAGGPGAVFWMWVTAFLGMATKFTCCMLAVHFREIGKDGVVAGGPMYYLDKGLGKRYLGVSFAIFTVIASFGIGNMVQANSVVDPFVHTCSEDMRLFVTSIIGVIMALLVGIVIIGGVKRIAKIAEKIVPFMAMVYVITALIIIALNIEKLVPVLKEIFEGAFGINAAVGGAAGYGVMKAMQFGIARGVFSNESGLGSAAIAHAAA